ncbi:MAG TPA: hypothetical protein VJA21_03380 [Verrucomicrobiae bacterium]
MTSINNDIDQQSGRPQSGLLTLALIAPTQQEFITKEEVHHRFITTKPTTRAGLLEQPCKADISRATVGRYLQRLTTAGLISSGGGLYWLPDRGTHHPDPHHPRCRQGPQPWSRQSRRLVSEIALAGQTCRPPRLQDP